MHRYLLKFFKCQHVSIMWPMARNIRCILSCMSIRIVKKDIRSSLTCTSVHHSSNSNKISKTHFLLQLRNLSKKSLSVEKKPCKYRTTCVPELKKWFMTFRLTTPNTICFFQTTSLLTAGAARSE